MKRLLLSALALCSGTALFAQNVQRAPIEPIANFSQPSNLAPTSNATSIRANGGPIIAAAGDTLYHETFGSGLAGDGTNGSWTNQGSPAAAVWEYRGTNTSPDNTVGSQGAYTGGGGAVAIASTTTANGFVIFDSDYLDNGGSSTNMGNGPAPTPHTGQLISPVMNLTNYNEVLIRLEVKYRRFVGDLYVVFSSDGGTTWPDSVLVFGDAAGTPTNSPHTDAVYTNYVSSFIGGSNNARMKLFFDGVESHGNTNGSGYYYAMVDDITVMSAPDNDLVLNERQYHSTFDTGHANHYTVIPKEQAMEDSIYFAGIMTNRGSAAQPNARMDVDITTPLGSTFTVSSGTVTSTPGSVDSVTTTPYTLFNMGTGTFDIDFIATSDSTDDVPNDNGISESITISDTVYARDNDNYSGNGRWYGAGQNYEIGPMFRLFRGDTAKSIDVLFQGSTQVGAIVSLHIYDATLTTPVVSRTFITLTANDIDQWTTFDITDTYLTAGDYIVTFETFSDSVLWSVTDFTSEADEQTVFVDPDNSGTWFFTTGGGIPYIRLNVAGTQCPNITGSILSSTNPSCGGTDGMVSLAASGSTASPYVYTWPDGTTGAMKSNLGAGSYTVTVSDNNNCSAAIPVSLSNTGGPAVDSETVVDITCNGDADGSIVVNSAAAQSFAWSNGSTGNSVSNLGAGTYSVTMTGAGGCVGIETYIITEPSEILASGSTTDLTCFGDANGEVNISVSGGTPGYTYSWSGPGGFTSTSGDISSLGGGQYDLTITDNNTCTSTESFTVVEPSELTATVTTDDLNGTASIIVSGGTPDYSYLWSNAETGSSASLGAGTHSVTVTDDNGCETVESGIVISGFEELSASAAVSAFPNPTNGELNVQFANAVKGVYTIEVTNLVGQTVFTKNVTVSGSSNVRIDLTNETNGVYFLSIEDEDGNRGSQKIIVE